MAASSNTPKGYATGPGSSPQTFMMYDIAALQQMYGANFGRAGTDAVYTWSADTGEGFIDGTGQGVPVYNHIFATVWTGGANSTYNLRNFNQDGSLDMRPGYGMKFSNPQLADLGFNNPRCRQTTRVAVPEWVARATE